MKKVSTKEYISALRELVSEGRTVRVSVAGGSMAPFLANRRDFVQFKAPDRPLRRGDIVFYERESGEYVMHRILRVREADGQKLYDITGDAQQELETGVRSDQIFGLVCAVERKGELLQPGDLRWEFFARIWPRLLPVRRTVMRAWARWKKRRRKR